MSNNLLRVRQPVTTTGDGTSIVLSPVSDGANALTMAEAGAIDGRPYHYIIDDGTDFEAHESETWTAESRTFTRGAPIKSKIGGVVGTDKIDLSGTAVLRIFASPDDMDKYVTGKYVQTLTDAEKKQAAANLGIYLPGQCVLKKNGSNLELQRADGRYLFIKGNLEIVPASPITLAPTGLTPDTLYYIYAFMSSGTMTLEASATAPATDATFGHRIKSGDDTRSLVGMARPVTGPAFADSASQRLVRSYFKRPGFVGYGAFTANRTRFNAAYGEVNSEIRIGFLVWDNENVRVMLNPIVFPGATTYDDARSAISFDGGTVEEATAYGQAPNSSQSVISGGISIEKQGLSAGYHYATMFGLAATATATWIGSGSGPGRTSLFLGVG